MSKVSRQKVPEGFRYIDRGGTDCWLHSSCEVWATRYEAIPGFRDYDVFYAYRAVERVPRGRMPWTVDNRSIGSKSEPFRTLAAAADAARAAAPAEVA